VISFGPRGSAPAGYRSSEYPASKRDQAQTQQTTKPIVSPPVPEPAIAAILAAFDKYEVVGLPQGHGMQDLNDFIFYIAGENVRFVEVEKVWRKMGQPACGASEFVERFFPRVRALNQKLPPEKHLRVLAGDSPVDWDQVKSMDDIIRLVHRDESIASVVEKEVLSKHRKALMLFGTFHLFHGVGGSAVPASL
jgi:hypothetical protein